MQNQTKPKPLGASMAKLFLAAAIIISLGAVLGMAGYLAKNKPVKVSQPQVTPALEPSMSIENYLIKDAVLINPTMPKEANYNAISAKEAALVVVQDLTEMNAKDIKIHQVLWFAAPFGGFYVAGDCNFDKESNHYTLFVASIGDGSEDVGEPTILFKGENKNIWSNNPEYLKYETYGEFLGGYKIMADFYNVTPLFTLEEIKNETTDWKIYRNEEYGFEVKYPRTLTLYENNNYKSSEDQRLFQLNKDSDIPFVTISRFEIEKGQTFEEIIVNNSWLPGGGPRHEDFSKFKLVKVGDNSYYYRYLCGSIGGPDEQGNTTCDYFYHYWLVKDQSVFEFELFDTLLTNNKNLDFENSSSHLELNQILSTFRFIE